MELNEKIKALRKERGMSQKELAKEIGVSDRTVSKWECGKGSVKIKELEKISKALRVHIDDLLPVDAVKDKAFLPCRISASPAAKATFIAAIAILSGAAAWPARYLYTRSPEPWLKQARILRMSSRSLKMLSQMYAPWEWRSVPVRFPQPAFPVYGGRHRHPRRTGDTP